MRLLTPLHMSFSSVVVSPSGGPGMVVCCHPPQSAITPNVKKIATQNIIQTDMKRVLFHSVLKYVYNCKLR